jgi:hypothetical protein
LQISDFAYLLLQVILYHRVFYKYLIIFNALATSLFLVIFVFPKSLHLQITPQEIALATDANIMLTKNRIVQAVYDLFGKLAEKYVVKATSLPPEVIRLHAKISRGENYLGLPWVMLDYPRHFSGKDGFAIRTMFWWGNYFSLHVLLQGQYMGILKEDFANEISSETDWSFCIGSTPWQHHFAEDYVVPLTQLTLPQTENQAANGFYKLSTRLPISQWQDALAFFEKKFAEALRLCNASASL